MSTTTPVLPTPDDSPDPPRVTTLPSLSPSTATPSSSAGTLSNTSSPTQSEHAGRSARRDGVAAPTPSSAQPAGAYAYTLSTTLLIQEFPSQAASPSYLPALADGSLLTPLYTHAQRDAAVLLFSCALFGIVFVRNIGVSYRYVRRIAARDMTLFYLLLFSQIWGPVACAVLLLPLVSDSVNCTSVNVAAAACAQISYSVLISGILGIKAYRCLNRSNAVLAAILLTQFSAWILTAFDFPHLGSARTLANICVFKHNLRLLPTAFILGSIETLIFVSMCFGYAVWNASQRSAQLGRISLDGAESPNLSQQQQQPPPRGWWDYAPNARRPTAQRSAAATRVNSAMSVAPKTDSRPAAWRIFPLRRKTTHVADDGWEKVEESDEHGPQRTLTGWTNGSGASPKFARMVLLNDAVRNELYYTGLILVCHTLAMIMVPISAKNEHIWPPIFWVGLSWTVTSLLVIQSFSQVVSRHEREDILREPALLGWGVADTLDAPTGPPRPKQTPWGRAVSFSTNSVFSSATAPTPPTHPHGGGALSRRPSIATMSSAPGRAALWANANPFSDAASVSGQTPPVEVWRRGSVSGMSASSGPAASDIRPGLRAAPNVYTAPGLPYAIPPVPERRGSNASSSGTGRTAFRRESAESLLR